MVEAVSKHEAEAVAQLEKALGVLDTPIDRVKRADGRVWIDGVPHESLVYGWDISLRGLHLMLRDRGEMITLDELSVLSGDAFHICFANAKDTCPELLIPTDALANAAHALGYEHEWLITDSGRRAHLGTSVPDATEREALTRAVLQKIRAQVDAGRPPLVGGASDQGCGNWSLVVGYNDAGTELCHNGLDGEPAGTWSKIRGISSPISDKDDLAGYWNGRPRGTVVPGFQGGWLVNPAFILGDKRTRPDTVDTIETSLMRAVELHNAESVHYFGGQHYFGVEAYQRWSAALAGTGGISDLMLDEVVRGRAAAAEFCDQSATHLPAAAAHLRRAAEQYRAEVELARKAFGDFIPFRWDNVKRDTWGSAEQRRVAAESAKQMLKHEQAAILEITKALVGLQKAKGETP